MNLLKMKLDEKIEFLRRHPIFWSRLGYELEKGGWEAHSLHAKRHKALFDQGIKLHSSIIPVGWIAPDRYDYTDTDRYLELLFTACPEAIFLPRVKLNVPKGWCEANPEDVFVYGCGPRKKEDIIAMIGTEVHGAHPFNSTDLIAQQSFFSRKWIEDASEALRRFIKHVEASPWADRIIGYHLAFGTSGETTQWGTWNPDPFHKGDYGINATKAFIEYAAKRGKHYDAVPPIEERFYIEEGGTPSDFQVGTPSLDRLFYHTEEDERSILYAEFTADGDLDAIEAFGKVVRTHAPQKLVGTFYGYLLEPSKSANTQHAGYDRLLSSPYIDFIASPKGYVRISPTDPGVGQAITNSINRKKLWVDEIDNRTHLCTVITRPQHDYPAKNFDETRAVYWREFTKNITHHQGYWWMDLGGGWLDSEEIQSEMVKLNRMSEQLYREKDTHQNVAEVLLVFNEKMMYRMRPNAAMFAAIHHICCTIKESGVPIDLYRTADLAELDLSRYKMIVFLNDFYEDAEELHQLLQSTAPGCHIIWNYAAGILDKKTGRFSIENVRKLTGFSIGEYPKEQSTAGFPLLYINKEEPLTVLEQYPDGRIKTAKRQSSDGRTHLLCAMPSDLTVETARDMLMAAGVHLYASAYCPVHADNRFIYVLSEKTQTVKITLKQPTTCRDEFTGKVYENITSLTQEMVEGTCLFLKYIQ